MVFNATVPSYRHFIVGLCQLFQEADPDWRQRVVFYLDNASFHKSPPITAKFEAFQVPVLYSGKWTVAHEGSSPTSVGPYSYDASPIEKIFATIKARDLNPSARCFTSRETADTYVIWLAEEIGAVCFGDTRGLFPGKRCFIRGHAQPIAPGQQLSVVPPWTCPFA